MKIYSAFIKYVHSQNDGVIFRLRVWHGIIREYHSKCSYAIASLGGKKNKVIATSLAGKGYAGNPQLIFEQIHAFSPDTDLVWLQAENHDYSCPEYVRIIPASFSGSLLQELASASVVIDNCLYFRSVSGGKRMLWIQTWHGGLGLKKIGDDEANRQTSKKLKKEGRLKNGYDLYLSDSDHLTRIYRSAFDYQGPVWKCGYPIEDELQIDRGERQTVRERYGLAEDTPILLYAPTFRSKHRWCCQLDVEKVLSACIQKFGGNWVLAVHWHPHMNPADKNLPGALDVTDTQSMQELVKAADAFISDYSSSIFQAVQCHIPCFIYADDYESYKMDRDLYYSFEELPFPYAFTNEDLERNIAEYDAALWEERWQAFAKRMGHVVTGHSAEDVAKVCVDFLNGKPKAEIMKEIPFETRF